MLQSISVFDDGRRRREEPLERIGEDVGDRRVYGRYWRLERPSWRKFAMHDWRMKVISDGDMLMATAFFILCETNKFYVVWFSKRGDISHPFSATTQT
jgi:hypothetical protein